MDGRNNEFGSSGPLLVERLEQEFDVSPGYVFRDAGIVARTSLTTSALEPQVRRQVQSVDAGLPVHTKSGRTAFLGESCAGLRR
jgi:hypothetical protein